MTQYRSNLAKITAALCEHPERTHDVINQEGYELSAAQLPDDEPVLRGFVEITEKAARRPADTARYIRECCDWAEQAKTFADLLPDSATIEDAQKLVRELIETKQKRFPLLTLKEIRNRPRLEFLIQDLFIERGTGILSGPYGTFKSFVVFDMGLCVSEGIEWQGREVKQGTVVYIAPEGAYTIADRLTAWMIRHGRTEEPENFYTIEIPALIYENATCTALIEDLREINPSFVILDTVAKCNVGQDENSNTAAGLLTYAMERISREFDCFVLGVHHTGKNGSIRGANGLPSNVDASIEVKATEKTRVVTFHCDRVKHKPFDDFSLVGREVELGHHDEYGRMITSLVFGPTATQIIEAPKLAKSDSTKQTLLDILKQSPSMFLEGSEWEARAKDRGIARSSFYDYKKQLENDHLIVRLGSSYKVREPIEDSEDSE